MAWGIEDVMRVERIQQRRYERRLGENREDIDERLRRVTLDESLALTALIAQKDPDRRSRFALRWLLRLLEEDAGLTIEDATLAASALAALGGRGHDQALSTLSALAERATSAASRNVRPETQAAGGRTCGRFAAVCLWLW